MFRNISVCSLLLVLLSAAATSGWSQTDSARLQGTITDTQGGVVAGAIITVTNMGTGRAVSVSSNAAGDYSVPALPAGRYRVEVRLEKFKTVSQEITLQVSQIAPVSFQLQPGEITTTIQVNSDVPLLESTSSDISDVVVGRQVTELPLNGRNFTQLATLVPGVTRGVIDGDASGGRGNAETFRYSNVGGAALAVNGLRPQANNFILDGVDNNESLVNTIVFFPPAEAIQEFRVDTSIAPAEFGRAGGGLVLVSLKSGSNAFHGSAFEFLRNDNLDAERTFVKANCPSGQTCKDEFRRNQFGGTLGGPILKDRLFFFVDYSGLRQFLPLGQDQATVPTPKMRAGDFSELLPSIRITNPATKQPFAGNVITPDFINKAGQNYLNAYPLPNVTTRLTQNYLVTRKQIQQFDDFDSRIDLSLGAKDSLFGRFSLGQDNSETTSRLAPSLPAGFGSGTNISYPRGLSIGETHTFSSTIINEFHFGFIRTKYGYTPPYDDIPLSANLGIVNANTSTLLGGGALIGGYNNQIEYTGDYGPYLVPQNSFEYANTLSWVKGAHNLKFGGTVIRREVNLFRPKAGKGYFFLFGNGQAPSPTGYEVSDLLAGFVNNYQIGPPFGMVGTRNWETGYFAQDDWKIARRLTLNLGLRYDLYTWPVEVGDRQSNFDLSTGRLVLAGQGSDGLSSFVPISKKNFAPRAGFAYDLTGNARTVLRGGYGIFYFVDRGGIDNQLAQNPPYAGIAQFNYSDGYRITLSGMAPLNSSDPRLATAPLPLGTLTALDLNNPRNVSVFATLPTNRNSYVQEWNLQLQQELGADMALSVGYVGTKGTKLATYYDYNRQQYGAANGVRNFPNLGSINVQDTIGNSNYQSLQAMLQRRLARGWQFTGTYTWAHAIDDSPGAFDKGNGGTVDYTNLRLERGNSSLDVRHRFVLSSLYELPFGRGLRFGRDLPGSLNTFLGGWQINGILTFQSGLPFDLTAQGNPNTHPVQVHAPDNMHTTTQYYDVSAFAQPAVNAAGVRLGPGNVARNLFAGPGTKNLDLSIFKSFHISERVGTQFRAEFYNFTNTPQFAQPNGDITSGQAGQITDTRLGTERQIQFALRVTF